ncbi:chemoreceptor glutamine deamidase CheD [Kerstersia similis]|uniref:chemoreceptor glutamine deamidase CheD n=1 Tax=Kerstersia similis TaxID=206505 RepID=UPI0039EFB170
MSQLPAHEQGGGQAATQPSLQASIHYFDQGAQCQAVKVLPNEYYVAPAGAALMLTTVLGSCVAACVRDGNSGVGGMNHFVLPGAAPAGVQAPAGRMRYGLHAMDTLIDELLKAGARRQHLQAKVFGGGAVLAGMSRLAVGASNASFVLDYLEQAEIPVLAQDLGGIRARRVNFFPATGLTRVRRFGGQQPDAGERAAQAWAATARVEVAVPPGGALDGTSGQDRQ